MKKPARAGLILFILLEPWLASLLHSEILTAKYCDESIFEACDAHGMLATDAIKILDYEPFAYCKAYGKSAEAGNVAILVYEFASDEWNVVSWHTVWSKSGSADGFVWPYIR